jgi:hypothetical protein
MINMVNVLEFINRRMIWDMKERYKCRAREA